MWILLGFGVVCLIVACTTVNVATGKSEAKSKPSLVGELKVRRDAPSVKATIGEKRGK